MRNPFRRLLRVAVACLILVGLTPDVRASASGHVLLISCSSRSECACPSGMSKSFRLSEVAREVFAAAPGVRTEDLELSRLAAEYGRHINFCEACFSTAAPL